MLRRMGSVEVVQAPRKGCQKRLKPPDGPVQAYARPGLKTMNRAVRPTFQLLLYHKARELAERANTIVLMADGKSFGVITPLGGCLSFTL